MSNPPATPRKGLQTFAGVEAYGHQHGGGRTFVFRQPDCEVFSSEDREHKKVVKVSWVDLTPEKGCRLFEGCRR
jgi:hypothetical protein